MDYNQTLSVAEEQQRFMTRVYGWMSFALLVTGLVAMFSASSPAVMGAIIGNRLIFFGLIIGQLLLVGSLSGWVSRMSANTAMSIFLLYSVLNGLTFSIIFLVYTMESIATTFYITAGTFAAMSLYGYFTKTDLTKTGSFLFMGLIGVIIASVANYFMKSEMLYWIISYVGVFIFIGLTAYDTQKIKNMNIIGNEGTDEDRKEAIMGALTLYLDFINLFLMLLRIFGRRK